jgi:type II secretory pathway component PulC
MPVRSTPVLAVWLLAACSAPPEVRDVPPADETDDAEPAPRGSGATTYVPTASKIPDGAIDRVLLDRVLAAGPGWLLSQVPLQPTFAAKHKFAGFQLVSIFRNDPKVLRYGIQPGDIVRAINGQKLVTPSDLLLVFERLKTVDTLEIDVSRGGSDLKFRFPVVPAMDLPASVTTTAP